MPRIINEFRKGNINVVKSVKTEDFALQIYDALKQNSEQDAIYFMEQYNYYKYTGNIMQ